MTHDLTALAQVLLIDVALAGDNAVVVGMAVAGLPPRSNGRRSSWGSVERPRSASPSARSRCDCWRSSA